MKRIAFLTAAALVIGVSAHAQGSAEPGPGGSGAPVGKDLTVHGFKMHYLEAGSGAPVILLHGTGGEGARWMPTIKALAAEYRVLAIDQIGYGDSDKPLTNYHTGVFADFLAGFMKAANIPKASLVGQSLGAGVALYFTVHHPEMVDRLVLVNGASFRSSTAGAPPPSAPDWYARQIPNAATLEESRDYLKVMYFDDSLITDAMVEHNLRLRLKAAFTITSMQNNAERGLGVVTEQEVKAVKTPTLLLWGANDSPGTVANADLLNAAISGSKKIMIDRAGHYPFLEQPAIFNKALLAFLKSTT